MSGALDWVKDLIGLRGKEPSFRLIPDRGGLNFQLQDDSVYQQLTQGKGPQLPMVQLIMLKQLAEAGEAEPIKNGYFVPSQFVVLQDSSFNELFGLPPHFDGSFAADVRGVTTQAAFNVRLDPRLSSGETVHGYKRTGPYLSLSDDENYLLNSGQLAALTALDTHAVGSSSLSTEEHNLSLIFALKTAAEDGFQCDLSHFAKFTVTKPTKVGVAVDHQPDGSILLSPTTDDGTSPDELSAAAQQLDPSTGSRSVRFGDRIVLFDEKRLEAVRQILENRALDPKQAKVFLETPSAFLDAALIDLDTGFCSRVQGAGAYRLVDFGGDDNQSMDWFGRTTLGNRAPELEDMLLDQSAVDRFREKVESAIAVGADSVVFEGLEVPLNQPEAIRKQVASIEQRIRDGGLADSGTESAEPSVPQQRAAVLTDDPDNEVSLTEFAQQPAVDFDRLGLLRQPYAHQKEGIQWILQLRNTDSVSGGLLADDMGTGKTFMALVALAAHMDSLRQSNGRLKPSLVVAPLALLENWEEEIAKTFSASPFADVVVLQSARDLRRYRIQGEGRETRQQLSEDEILQVDQIRYALKIGSSYGHERLDMTGRLVLMTYDTLRDYQFSLCRVDWDFCIFDEAQEIKNLNAHKTRAAKGLKADFKLLATGTPVENSLGDFWCLMDTAIPGLLEDWASFRHRYVRPITDAEDDERHAVRAEVGAALRREVGSLMLRRMKEDVLDGLPKKLIHVGAESSSDGPQTYYFDKALAVTLRDGHLQTYDRILEQYRSNQSQDGGGKGGGVLQVLARLRETSMHPDVTPQAAIRNANWVGESVKMQVVFELLESIRKKNEKVILFLVNKTLQSLISAAVQARFGIPVPIINGDTKATGSNKGAVTRKTIIDDFQQQDGFGVLILSPIAAGVGLTVTAANHVVHVERHWNPAKEAQATDRVYRIGQQRPVHIYIPIVHHPEAQSFEATLNQFLSRKIDLKDAVVTSGEPDPEELARTMNI